MNENVDRELQKIEEALKWAVKHFEAQSEANAAFHTSEKVMYSPLAVKLFNAVKSVDAIRNEFEV